MTQNLRDPVIRTMPRPADINLNGHIFGGWILSQMDIAGGIASIRVAGGRVATVAVEAMKFHQPILITDLVSVYAEVVRTGRTSLTVNMEVMAKRRAEGSEVKVTEGTFIYVRIDDEGRPVPIDE